MTSKTALATIQQMYADFGAGNIPGFLGALATDVRWRFIGAPGVAYSAEVRGPEGVQAWLGKVMESDDIQAFEPREFFAGENHVTVIGWERTIARPTGRAFEADWMHLFEVSGGRVSRFLGLYDTAAAAKAYAR
jgi:ketosteroid isomerase-like protein